MRFTDYFLFQNKVVRDLAWSIFSSNLIVGEFINDHILQENKEKVRSWLKEVDEAPQKLVSFIEERPTSNRLGKYFENLLHFAFINSNEYACVHHGLQVKRSKDLTLGEFDFILQSSKDKSWTHLEVAVKFYLANETANKQTLFIGPNAKDRLDLKLDKLYSKQLQLSSTPEGNRLLSELDVVNPQRQLLVKGYLFYELTNPALSANPNSISDYANKGWWSYFKDYPFTKHNHKMFVLLNKLEWLSPFLGDTTRVVTATKLQNLIESKKVELPQLIVEVEEKKDYWIETNRGFLVTENWAKQI